MVSPRFAGFLPAVLVAFIATGCGGGGGSSGSANPPPPPDSSTLTSSLSLTSDVGEFVGDGKSYSYTQANAGFKVTEQSGLLSIEVLGDDKWRGVFQMPSGNSTLATGTYNNLGPYQLHDPLIGGLRWVRNGRTCAGINGSVTIRKATYEAAVLTELDMQFTEYCDGTSFALRGELRWSAKDTTTPPGPTAPPAGLWQPPSGATPTSGTYVYLESQPDDYIGGGGTYLYTQTTARILADVGDGNVRVHVAGDEFWDGTFQGMSTLSELKPGYYRHLQSFPVHNPAFGGIDWSGESRICFSEDGWFVVDSITYSGSMVVAADIRFEQRCLGRTGALHGKIHLDVKDTSQPPGPATPPSGLWQPAAGTTPATGNYVYFEMPTGNFLDSGKTFLYTQANSILTTRNHEPGVSFDIDGNRSWVADFQAMDTVGQLEVGFYGNLQQYPWHNPTVGGTSFRSDSLLCGSGWFVVDAVAYEGSTLKSIDLRFEVNCGGPTALLRGKIHWSDSDTTVPPGPTAPPAGLWQAPVDATPASGTYAYFESEIDPAIPTRTFLYTPDNAQFIVDSGLALALFRINASDGIWSGAIQGMSSLTRFEVGYYGDLQRYPFHNPAKGGLDWASTLTGGCSDVKGWFVIDAVTYSGSTLTSIDLRFERRCGSTAVVVRGQLRWSQ